MPVSLSLAGWILCAVPVAGLFGLVMPTRSRIIRLLSSTLLITGLVAMVAMSKPRGIDSADWRLMLAIDGVDATAFLRAVEISSYTVMAALLLWALVAAVILASSRRTNLDDLWVGVRRSALLVGPLAIAASFAAVQLA